MAKWTIGQFSKFVRSVEANYGLDRATAREVYKEMREATGRPVFASALKSNRLTADEAVRTVRIAKQEEEFWKSQNFPEDIEEGYYMEFEDEDEY